MDVRSVLNLAQIQFPRLTAYAIRSPLESEESCVGRPRLVVGEAAKILSMAIDMEQIFQDECFMWIFFGG